MWRKEPNGDLSAELNGKKLVVRPAKGFARYLLLGRWQRRRGGPQVLLESGCEDDPGSAKEKAMRRALALP